MTYTVYDRPVFSIEEIEEILILYGGLEEGNEEPALSLINIFQAEYKAKAEGMDVYVLDSGEIRNEFIKQHMEDMDPEKAERVYRI